ncbi:MAG: ribosome assembly cofactor RimP [Muribaculaceae bacterium]|nr:ribosome assembly cofactor RimP [Muribaculaceae bacterium]
MALESRPGAPCCGILRPGMRIVERHPATTRYMIDRQALSQFIESRLEGSDCFLVDLEIGADNDITVEIDSDSRVDIERCIELTHDIENEFDRDVEDYSLEVGSSGITSPFKVLRQWRKNVGAEIEVLTADGRKLHGVLRAAGEESFTLAVTEKVRHEGAKRPVEETRDIEIPYSGVKRAECVLKF